MIELLLEAESALSLGLLDRAEILYRQVAGADPRNSIAVVGLARVMLERGDEVSALKHARRALAIDSENTAAQRMVRRLEEVLAYREHDGSSGAAALGSRPDESPGRWPTSPPPTEAPPDVPEAAYPEPNSPAPDDTALAGSASDGVPAVPADRSTPGEPTRVRQSLIDRLFRRR